MTSTTYGVSTPQSTARQYAYPAHANSPMYAMRAFTKAVNLESLLRLQEVFFLDVSLRAEQLKKGRKCGGGKVEERQENHFARAHIKLFGLAVNML